MQQWPPLNCTTPPWGLVRCKSVVVLARGRGSAAEGVHGRGLLLATGGTLATGRRARGSVMF